MRNIIRHPVYYVYLWAFVRYWLVKVFRSLTFGKVAVKTHSTTTTLHNQRQQLCRFVPLAFLFPSLLFDFSWHRCRFFFPSYIPDFRFYVLHCEATTTSTSLCHTLLLCSFSVCAFFFFCCASPNICYYIQVCVCVFYRGSGLVIFLIFIAFMNFTHGFCCMLQFLRQRFSLIL